MLSHYSLLHDITLHLQFYVLLVSTILHIYNLALEWGSYPTSSSFFKESKSSSNHFWQKQFWLWWLVEKDQGESKVSNPWSLLQDSLEHQVSLLRLPNLVNVDQVALIVKAQPIEPNEHTQLCDVIGCQTSVILTLI